MTMMLFWRIVANSDAGVRGPGGQQGFTLIELLIVLVVTGILVAIAVPSYLGFRTRAADSAAKANIRAALPAVEQFLLS